MPDFLLPYSVILDRSFTLSDLKLQFLVKTKICVALVVSLRTEWRKLFKNIKSILHQYETMLYAVGICWFSPVQCHFINDKKTLHLILRKCSFLYFIHIVQSAIPKSLEMVMAWPRVGPLSILYLALVISSQEEWLRPGLWDFILWWGKREKLLPLAMHLVGYKQWCRTDREGSDELERHLLRPWIRPTDSTLKCFIECLICVRHKQKHKDSSVWNK